MDLLDFIPQEQYNDGEIDGIIEYNRRLMAFRKEEFEVERDILVKTFLKVNAIGPAVVPDRRDRIIKKAAHIMYGIAFRQPFFEGNKTTALFTTIDFLRQNHFDLPLETVAQEQEIYDFLVKVMFASKELVDVIEFLDEKVVTYRAR